MHSPHMRHFTEYADISSLTRMYRITTNRYYQNLADSRFTRLSCNLIA